MTSLDQLRVCKNYGNVFSKKTGATNITECPQCKGVSFEQIVINHDPEDKVYLDELD
jgi:hypothetical protein